MSLAKTCTLAISILIAFATTASAELLSEHVSGGSLDLHWAPGFETANTMYGKTLDSSNPAYANPSGDHTVAVAQNASPDSGGIIVTVVDPGASSSDYTWEGWVFTGGGDTRRGIVLRATPGNHFETMYQFVIQAGLFQITFRKLDNQTPTTLGNWFATVLPAGSIPQNTWHKMKVIAIGDHFRCFFDDFELTTTPIIDASIPSGWVGCYNFRFDLGNVPVYFDDLVLSCVNEVAATVDVSPNALNLSSLGRWVTAVIEPTAPASASDIDASSIRLNGTVKVDPSAPIQLGDADADGIPDLQVRFLRSDVDLAVSEGAAVPVTVSGLVGGDCFSGTDKIKVLHPHVLAPSANQSLTTGAVTTVRWEVVPGNSAPTAALLSSLDGGATWSVEARDVPNTGSMNWVVPSTPATQARLAVVQIESSDADGLDVQGILGTSETFAISSPLAVTDGSLRFSLRGIENPSNGSLRVAFALPGNAAATLAVYDVGGRVLARREVGEAGPGVHTMTLVNGAPAGIYVVRLTQGGKTLSTRLSVVR
jgi:hypothetical protein